MDRCQHRRLVAQKLLHHLHVRTGTDRQRGAGVPQIVQPYPVDLADRRHRLGESIPRLPGRQVPAAARLLENQRAAITVRSDLSLKSA